MSHEHHHHSHNHIEAGNPAAKRPYIIAIVLNLLFVAVEATVGILSGSLGLVSDAGHNLSDVFSLILALIAVFLAASHATERFTYGYRKSSVLISLLNAVILLVAVGAIVIESIHKLSEPAALEINGAAVSWTAGIGILINGFTAWLLSRGSKGDINARGAFLHMLADTLVSVGVVISGLIITFTGWDIIDPIVSLVIAAVIAITTWDLLAESLRLSIDAVPETIDIKEIEDEIKEVEGVLDVHHIHIWPISTTEVALTAHIVFSDGEKEGLDWCCEKVEHIKHHLREHGIRHATIEIESAGHPCHEHDCD